VLEQGFQLRDHRQRRQLVMLGAGDVHLEVAGFVWTGFRR
jgi:hypothetical protein